MNIILRVQSPIFLLSLLEKQSHLNQQILVNPDGNGSQYLKKQWAFEDTFGYETKFKREQILHLPKTHYCDAVAICCEDGELIQQASTVFHKRHVANGDYQQTKGIRSEKRIPTGKLFGLKKFDFVQTPQGTGFVKGKRSSGYFALETILGKKVHASANINATYGECKQFLPALKHRVSLPKK